MSVLRTLLASLAIAVAGVVVLAAATDRFQVFTTQAAHRLDVRKRPAAVPDAALETSTGAAVTMADFRGAWLAVDFIYTRCMTYCTVLGGDFAQLQGLLAAPLQQGRLHLLSITFDAEHDDPAALARYKQQFRDRGIGWTAARPVNDAARAALLRAFGVKAIPDGLGGFVHDASISVVDPDGRLVDVFDPGQPAVVADYIEARLAR